MPDTMDKIKEKLHLGHKDEAKPQSKGHAAPPPPADEALRSGGPPPPPYSQPAYPPQAQYVAPPRPDAHGMQQAGQNIGMMTSVMGNAGGVGGGGMWQDMAVGGFVGQQIGQVQNRAYWREQQNRYYSGLPAAGIADPRVAEPMSDRERRRAGRRKERWDRRAGRRGIEVPTQAAPGPPGGYMAAAPMAAAGAAAGHHGHHGQHGHPGNAHGHHSSGHDTSGSESDHLSDGGGKE